jgi:hypothetical protein
MDQNPIPVQNLPAPNPTPPPGYGYDPATMSPPPPPHHPARIWAIIATLLLLVFIGLFGWAFSQYQSYRNDVQPKIDTAVDGAVKLKQKELEESFQLERERLKLTFRTNDRIANVSFMYPRDWSQYLTEKESGRLQIESILHPTVVQEGQVYALRLQVYQQTYDDVLRPYQTKIEKGELKAQPIKNGSTPGVRLDGQYERDRDGALVVFPIRDKTLVLMTESKAYLRVFNEVVKTLNFTP